MDASIFTISWIRCLSLTNEAILRCGASRASSIEPKRGRAVARSSRVGPHINVSQTATTATAALDGLRYAGDRVIHRYRRWPSPPWPPSCPSGSISSRNLCREMLSLSVLLAGRTSPKTLAAEGAIQIGTALQRTRACPRQLGHCGKLDSEVP